jgi:tRNA nucleotidyltransferase (CCA-adding enzyme)
MTLKEITKELELDIDDAEMDFMSQSVKEFISNITRILKSKKIKADVFVGGSFAKKTMIKSDSYDIDVFVRFYNDGELSDLLEKAIKELNSGYVRVHGSRDYFQVPINNRMTFEVIPTLKIKNPKEAKNVTDLSYFHVNYVKKHITGQIAREIKIAKQFLKAQMVYGAEGYIGGISGYGVEGLIIYYKTFENFIKNIVKSSKKIIIDPENKYKGKNALIELNESKIESPIVLVDPTFRERNVLAALRNETFEKLRESSQKILKKPSVDYFKVRDIKFEIEALMKYADKISAQFVKVNLNTDKQEGDIAGTKMKKFSDFFISEIERYFEVIKRTYSYGQGKDSQLYLVVKPLNEIIRKGPPLELVEHAKAFRKEHKNTFMKAGVLYAKIEGYDKFESFLKNWIKNNKEKIKGMDITGIEID